DAPIGDRSKWKAKWPELEEVEIKIGEGKITREGEHATIVSFGRPLPLCNRVADMLREEGHSIEVIDMRSIYPYDWQMIKKSIQKTGRVLFVNEDTEVTNFGEHLSQRTVTELFYELMARPRVLAGKQLPGIGLHPNLEEASVPHLEDILHEARARQRCPVSA
ncbi:MAG: alpha-ketoacid dehydrogenase subunit beta, partial [Proteobacteria bacterium]